ncbi:MAG: hypothetical protein GY906_10340 [bacterium]|nr:hypothetical protein [bacterium]
MADPKLMKVADLPSLNERFPCPTCTQDILPEEIEIDYETLVILTDWTVGQLVSFIQLARNSGLDFAELAATVTGGVMPGIGGALAGDVGTIAIPDLNGIFVGIEPDGYAHS